MLAESPKNHISQLSIRRSDSQFLRWWLTIDRWTLWSLCALIVTGVILGFAASPSVALRLKLDGYYFIKRHLLILCPAVLLMLGVSMLSPRSIRRLATFIYIGGIALLVLTLFMGVEIKGARRWLSFSGFSIQASEFVKPALSVLVAWMLAEKVRNRDFPGISLVVVLAGVYLLLLLLQPDVGMSVVVVSTWLGQLFIGGIPLLWVFVIGGLCLAGLGASYFFLPHVSARIDQFLGLGGAVDKTGELYQVTKSLSAFASGGLFGKGPGEGIIKKNIPDVHADFVFAVAGEEFGLILCILLVALFMVIIIRSLVRANRENSLFVVLAAAGLVIQFSLQAFINMSSTLNLIPTKGMTLPFISYGGSSMLAVAISMGMLLALTRQRQSMGDRL